jgi:hypothetical protein
MQIIASRIALVLALGVTASTSAHALPHFFGVHRHPGDAQSQDSRVTVHISNKGDIFRDIKVGGHVYTVWPHQMLTIKAPAGTAVYTESTGSLHRKGDLLFAVGKQLQGAIAMID